jgi:hypothetical protein
VDANTKVTGGNIAWRVLAVVDALALAYVVYNAPWGMLNTAQVHGEYAWLARAFTIAIDLAWNGIAAAFVVAVGYGIAGDIRGEWRPSRVMGALASMPLLVCTTLAVWAAYHDAGPIFAVMTLPDRATVFDALAQTNASGESIGARIAWVAAAAYLGEKYLLRWWNLRWPVSIIALAMIAWPALAACDGESRQRDWLEAQQWRSIGDGKTWVQALQACSALGPGWRLPRPHELPLYVASEPEALHGARGRLWTSVTSDLGRAAVVVELQPRLKGFWRSSETPHRDRSTCELDANRNTPLDWFAKLRPRLCESGFLAESMFVTTEQLIAYVRGTRATPAGTEYIAAETTAGTVCVNPKGEELRKAGRRTFARQEEFTDAEAFLARMRAVCNPRQPGADTAACAAFGRQEPATNATAG